MGDEEKQRTPAQLESGQEGEAGSPLGITLQMDPTAKPGCLTNPQNTLLQFIWRLVSHVPRAHPEACRHLVYFHPGFADFTEVLPQWVSSKTQSPTTPPPPPPQPQPYLPNTSVSNYLQDLCLNNGLNSVLEQWFTVHHGRTRIV